MPGEFDLLYTKEEHREKYLFIGGKAGWWWWWWWGGKESGLREGEGSGFGDKK